MIGKAANICTSHLTELTQIRSQTQIKLEHSCSCEGERYLGPISDVESNLMSQISRGRGRLLIIEKLTHTHAPYY